MMRELTWNLLVNLQLAEYQKPLVSIAKNELQVLVINIIITVFLEVLPVITASYEMPIQQQKVC